MSLERNIRRCILAGLQMLVAIAFCIAPVARSQAYTKDDPLKVVIVLDGTRGDKSFLDSAVAGLKRAETDMPISLQIVEAGYDPGRWEPALADAADGDFDVVICGTFNMSGYLAKLAPQYPEKKFVLYDETLDYKSGNFANVLSIRYRTADAGYLAGYVAAKLSKTGTLGTILGMEVPPVLDTKVGFDQGAKAANPNIKILNAVAGVFNDPAKGKEMAFAFIDQGADVVMAVAGGTGVGSLQAAKDAHKFAIGSGSDQAMLFDKSDPSQADVIVTSYLKNVGQSLYNAIRQTLDGTAPYGTSTIQGLKDGSVGIATSKYYEKLVPSELRTEVQHLSDEIASGKIKVTTALR